MKGGNVRGKGSTDIIEIELIGRDFLFLFKEFLREYLSLILVNPSLHNLRVVVKMFTYNFVGDTGSGFSVHVLNLSLGSRGIDHFCFYICVNHVGKCRVHINLILNNKTLSSDKIKIGNKTGSLSLYVLDPKQGERRGTSTQSKGPQISSVSTEPITDCYPRPVP